MQLKVKLEIKENHEYTFYRLKEEKISQQKREDTDQFYSQNSQLLSYLYLATLY